MNKNQEFIYSFTKYIFYTVIFLLCYILFYNQLYSKYPADLEKHVNFIDEMVNGKIFIPHPLFHYITHYTSKIFNLDIKVAAILINSSLVVSLALIVHGVLNAFLSDNVNKFLKLFLVFTVLFSGTIFLKELGLTKYQYVGNGSISIWHNVTTYMVKPFAFLAFFIFFYAIGKDKNYFILLLLSFIFALASMFAKPSFIVIFLPMILLFVGYQFIKKNLSKEILIYAVALLIATVAVLWWQATITYTYSTEEPSDIIFAPFEVWRMYSDNILISIIVGNLFIILFSIISFKQISERSFFALVMLIGGIILYLFLAESGWRLKHGNLGWSYILTMQLVYLTFIIDFLNNFNKINKVKRELLFFALSTHLVFGVHYFIKIFFWKVHTPSLILPLMTINS